MKPVLIVCSGRLLGEDFVARLLALVRSYPLVTKSFFGRYLMKVTVYIHCFPNREIIKY